MKVLFLSPFVWDSSYRGRYHHFFRRLVASGHSVVVLEPRLSGGAISAPEAGLSVEKPSRSAGVWHGAVETVERVRPDIVVAAAPPGLRQAFGNPVPWLKATAPRDSRPLLVFDYSDEHYLPGIAENLGPFGFLGTSLGRKAIAALARHADLVLAASEALRRQLPPGAALLPNPPGSRWGRAPVAARAPSVTRSPQDGRLVRLRRLSVAVVAPPEPGVIGPLAELANSQPDLMVTLMTSDVPAPAAREAGIPAVADTGFPPNFSVSWGVPEGRLDARLGRHDAVVLLPGGTDETTTAPGGPAREAVGRLLAGLSAGRQVLAAAALRPALAGAARAADLTSSELVFFDSFDDLAEKLLRFSLTGDPGRARRIEAKADRLRWVPAAEAFCQALTGLLKAAHRGAARG